MSISPLVPPIPPASMHCTKVKTGQRTSRRTAGQPSETERETSGKKREIRVQVTTHVQVRRAAFQLLSIFGFGPHIMLNFWSGGMLREDARCLGNNMMVEGGLLARTRRRRRRRCGGGAIATGGGRSKA